MRIRLNADDLIRFVKYSWPTQKFNLNFNMSSILKNSLGLILILLAVTACHKRAVNSTSTDNALPSHTEQNGRRMDNFTFLRLCMQGDFSSEQQSKSDSDFFDIRLRMVPIWANTPDNFYLYVEQAIASSIDKPYRQRIYKVEKIDETHFVSKIYIMNYPARFTGKKSGDSLFNEYTKDSLILKDGCEVKLVFNPGKSDFGGSTGDQTCPSDRSGASWATSKVVIDEEKMVSWDQGWDAKGKQVWGAVKGGYIFTKNR